MCIFARMQNRDKTTLFKLPILALLVLAVLIAVLMLIADHPVFVERYYSNGFYLLVCYIMHPIFNLFPFSMGDLLYIGIIGYLVYAFIRLIWLAFKTRWIQAGLFFLKLVTGLDGAVLIFYLFWGMNYFRPPAAKRLNLQDTNYTLTDLKGITALMIDSANACRAKLTTADLQTHNDAIFKSAESAIGKLSAGDARFKTFKPRIKASLLSGLLNYLGTSGYYNPFTTEAQINYQMPVYLRPFVACHEMSHQMGYGPEDEANFVGFIAGIKSPDRLLRYSAYYIGAEEFLYAMRQQDSVMQKLMKKNISPAVRADLKNERAYWLSYQGSAGILSSIFYDDFLKANNQPQGLRTYNRMVLLVMGYYKKHKMMVFNPI